MLGVHQDTLVDHGAVLRRRRTKWWRAIARSRAKWLIAVTGIAGPTGGMPDKPVGTVWFVWKILKNPIISMVLPL